MHAAIVTHRSSGAVVSDDIKHQQDNLRDEFNGAALYTALADAEPDPLRKDLRREARSSGH